MAPILQVALPAIIGSIVRAIGISSGAATAALAQGDELQAAIGAAVASVFALWGVVQKIRSAK